MAIQFNKSEAALKEAQSVDNDNPSKRKKDGTRGPDSALVSGSQSRVVAGFESCLPSFTNTTNTGLKVKMPDSVHIFLPGETIEFIEKDLGTDGAQKELDRRARRAAKKQKVSRESDQIKRYGDVAQKVKIESYIVVNPNNPKKQYQFRLSSLEEAKAYFRKRFKEDIDLSHVKERSGCVVLPNGHVFRRRDMIKYVPKLP